MVTHERPSTSGDRARQWLRFSLARKRSLARCAIVEFRRSFVVEEIPRVSTLVRVKEGEPMFPVVELCGVGSLCGRTAVMVAEPHGYWLSRLWMSRDEYTVT